MMLMPDPGQRRLGLVAHDRCKNALVDWVRRNAKILRMCEIVSTENTGRNIEKLLGCGRVSRVRSGPLGGDAQIAAQIVEGSVHGLVFLIDPEGCHPHEADIKMLQRVAVLYDVPLALNLATATMMLPEFVSPRCVRAQASLNLRN